jgi:hypothetical protein
MDEEKKKLFRSQKELLIIKDFKIKEATAAFNQTLNLIGIELGVPQEDLIKWRLSEDYEFLEKIKT